jgi:hypothetical protein
LPIQLADFAAFALNRTQILMAKAELNDLDRELLAILSPIAWNYQNIPKIIWPLDSDPRDYSMSLRQSPES